jgi:hypothetical protein
VSWLSQFVHNPGQMITHKPLKALALLAAPIAAMAAPFVAPELIAGLGMGAGLGAAEGAAAGGALAGEGALAGLGAEGVALGGESALGLGTFGAEAGSGALGFAPETSAFAGALPESAPAGFLEAGAGTPGSFYDAVGFGAGGGADPATSALGYLDQGPPLSGMGPASISPEMAAGAPFADSAVGQAMVNAGLVPANASPGVMSSAMSWIKANPMMAATLGLGGLGMVKNLIGGLPNEGALKGVAGQAGQMAGQLGAEGQNLLGPIQGGPLPAALEQRVVNNLNDADAATKGRFAKLGLSGSTMETDAINHNRDLAQELRGTLALQLAQAGSQLLSIANQDLGIEAGVFQNLMNAQIAQDNALEAAIASFAGQAAMASAISSRPSINVRAA